MEKQLIRECLAGDRVARERLLRGHSKRVYAVCLGILGNAHDAEDLAQEALVKGLTRMQQLRNGEQFGGWIARIARNLCIDFIRRRKRTEETMALPNPASEGTQDRYTDLYAAVAKLPEDYRLPLLLYYFDGRSSESVAETLGMSAAGVLTRLSRARKELRDLLDPKEAHDG
jgi:RNA polymerase sigma-70 factor (ECF subfamily)